MLFLLNIVIGFKNPNELNLRNNDNTEHGPAVGYQYLFYFLFFPPLSTDTARTLFAIYTVIGCNRNIEHRLQLAGCLQLSGHGKQLI